MIFEGTAIPGVILIKNRVFLDERGAFCKSYHEGEFREHDLVCSFAETYFSISKKDVIRGMHFQAPPVAHDKLVTCVRGQILDVILDLRVSSAMFGKHKSFELTAEKGISIFIPKGCAHGFLSVTDDTIVQYQVSSLYDFNCDQGLAFNSFGMDWGVLSPILSVRDQSFPKFDDFRSPF